MDLELTGKVAIVTGGSRGIGKAIAHALAREGANIALIGRDATALNEAAEEIARKSRRQCNGFSGDTGNDSDVKKAIAAIAAEFGRIDILVNAAAQPGGQSRPPKLPEITDEHFWADMNVKVMGYLRCAREVAAHMAKLRGGRIVNISGLAARQTGSTIGSIRNVSVAAMSKNLADELAPLGIAVVCVHPGMTRTEKTAGVLRRRADALGIAPEEVERRWGELNLIGRLVTAEEVADAVAFLASPKAIAINGDAIAVGGGAPGSIYY